MSKPYRQGAAVGNDFMVARRPSKLIPALPVAAPMMAATATMTMDTALQPREYAPVIADGATMKARTKKIGSLLDYAYRYSVGVFAVLLLVVGSAATIVGGNYWSAHVYAAANQAPAAHSTAPIAASLNLTIPSTQLSATLAKLINQPAILNVGSQKIALTSADLSKWFVSTTSTDHTQSYIHVDPSAVSANIEALASSYTTPAVGQIVATENGVATTIVAGTPGTKLADPSSVAAQALDIAKHLLSGSGFNINAPVVNAAAGSSSLASLGKVLDADVTTKRMYAFDNGQLIRTFLVTAGAPATPTPLGEFHIWEKLPVQDMTGFNPNGTRYNQPNVQWINYFDHNGDAVHGNYWRPASYFGNINSSHGCVSVPNADAEWIYNWAPVGTTVITHA